MKKGAKTVNSKENKTLVHGVTVCLTVCVEGYKLPPMVVYKGQSDEKNATIFKGYPLSGAQKCLV